MKISLEDAKAALMNAVFWAGALGIVTGALKQNFELVVFAAAVAAIDLALMAAFGEKLQGKQAAQGEGTVVFNVTPVQYPKVHDRDVNEFVPEFYNLDIESNGAKVFSGQLARDAFKNLSEMLNNSLSKQPAAAAPAKAKGGKKK